MKNHRPFAALLAVVALSLLWSALHPADWGVWAFELSLSGASLSLLLMSRAHDGSMKRLDPRH